MDKNVPQSEVVRQNNRKIKLCADVLEEVNEMLILPILATDKANLLLESERLLDVAFQIAQEARAIVWESQTIPPNELS
jgi:hypothetical protein